MWVWPDGASDRWGCPGSSHRNRQVSRRHHVTQVIENRLPVQPAIAPAQRPAHPRTSRGQRLEAQTLQITCAADVPGIRNHEAAGLMHLPKGAAPGCDV